MVNLITTSDKKSDPDMRKLSELLVRQTPSITTILHTISDRKAQIAFGEREQILWGNGYIEELLGDYRFRISANSFFQTNTKQTENLYQIVSDWGNFSKDDLVFDLYCGAGSISIFIARQVQKVVGFELAPQAIEDAKVNCQLNNVENCHFIQGDLREQLIRWESLIAEHGKPTKIVIDPPRSGLHPDLPKKILALAPERIIYVSCNPATLARDLRLLCESDYCLTNVQPVDMFPHTAHCEVVTLLTRTEAI
jgi:23S rRNA (uracil1939-C5)-methyltransferase